MSFTHAAFALAGLIAAAGPVVIHLLNRRRYRTVEWGAMAFLRKAASRSRRAVKLRDLLLLVFRTAAVLLFGLALARPVLTRAGAGWPVVLAMVVAAVAVFGGLIAAALARGTAKRAGWGLLAAAGLVGLVGLWQTRPGLRVADAGEGGASGQPVHAILVIDNSRSMAAESLGGMTLDAAKSAASAVVDKLPGGSRVSVLPLCGPERSYTLDAYPNGDDARAAIDKITITDRAGGAAAMLGLAAEAARRAPDLPAKRVVFFGDQQATGWPRKGLEEAAKDLPGGVQVVAVGANGERQPSETPSNVWVDSFEVQDGLAEAGLPATFLATIRYEGDAPAEGVTASLTVAGTAAAGQTIDLKPGQARQLVFTAPIDADSEPGRPTFVPATLNLTATSPAANRLDRDDSRPLAVPVVSSLPVVFVDQYGSGGPGTRDQGPGAGGRRGPLALDSGPSTLEDLDAGRVGETYRLRRLLAPRMGLTGEAAPLVGVRHVSIDGLDERTLEDARLVVVAGVERPTEDAARLLREYVEQGGPLLIAAGGRFDPAAWTATAWAGGRGVLPAPLADLPAGVAPSEATSPGQVEPFFLDVSTLGDPLFQIEGESAESLGDLYRQPFFFKAVAAEVTDATTKAAVDAETARLTGLARDADSPSRTHASGLDGVPSWLLWATHRSVAADDKTPPAVLAARTAPRVIGRYAKAGPDGKELPFLVERRIGAGRAVLLTSGLSSDWDTLAQSNAVVILDRIARGLIEATLPRRRFEAGEPVALPVERRPGVIHTVTNPDGAIIPVSVDATGAGYAVRLPETSIAGLYAVSTRRASDDQTPVESTPVAVVGPPEESDLTPLTAAGLDERFPEGNVAWVGPGEEVSLTGGPVHGDRLWKWLAFAVLACLLAEMLVALRRRPAETAT